MSAGDIPVPIVFRGPNGSASAVAAQHSQDFSAWCAEHRHRLQGLSNLPLLTPPAAPARPSQVRAGAGPQGRVALVRRGLPRAHQVRHPRQQPRLRARERADVRAGEEGGPGARALAPRDHSPRYPARHRRRYGSSFSLTAEAASPDFLIPLGQAKIEVAGTDVTIATFSRSVGTAIAAAQQLKEKHGISAEVRVCAHAPL